MEGMFFYAVILVIMGVLGWFRRLQENKSNQRRMDEPNTSIEDLPEATRRQLYGDTAQPIREARPAQRSTQTAPPVVPTARARQQRPARQAPPRRQAQPRTQSASQQQQTPSAPAQPQAQQPTMKRMRSALEQMAETMQDQMDQIEGRPAAPPPPPRRRATKSPQQLAAEQAKQKEAARLKRTKSDAARAKRHREMQAATARKSSKHILGNINDLRRGIILSEILGTPKGLEF